MANYLATRCSAIFFSIKKVNSLVPVAMGIGIGNDISYKCYSSQTYPTKLSSHHQPQTLRQNKLKPINVVQQLHTSCTKCEIFNIQDEEDFKTRVLNSKKAIIVDFHAKWCGPCKILMPRLETAIIASKEKVDLAKVDIDDLPDIAMEYNVGAVPSVLAIKNGSVVDKFVGLKDDDQIGTFIAAAAKK